MGAVRQHPHLTGPEDQRGSWPLGALGFGCSWKNSQGGGAALHWQVMKHTDPHLGRGVQGEKMG